MADELARAYFEKLKAAEQQIFELQLELAAKNKSTVHATNTVAASHDGLRQRIPALEEDNARLRDGTEVANGNFEDEDDFDGEEAQVVMCDCGIDLLAQMQENKALQTELKTERLKFQVIQGQVKNLRKQVTERDEKISELTAQNAVQVKREQTEVPVENELKRKRTANDHGLPIPPGNNGNLNYMSLPAQDHRQHSSRAAINGHNPHPHFAAGFPFPTAAQTPTPLFPANQFYGPVDQAPMFSPSFVPPQPFIPQVNFTQQAPARIGLPHAPSSIKATNTRPTPVTHPHPDRAKLVREESRVPKKVLETPASPQDSSTESELDDDGPTALNVQGFPNDWRLPRIKEYLSNHDLNYLIIRRPQVQTTTITFSDRDEARNAVNRLCDTSIDGTILKVSFAGG